MLCEGISAIAAHNSQLLYRRIAGHLSRSISAPIPIQPDPGTLLGRGAFAAAYRVRSHTGRVGSAELVTVMHDYRSLTSAGEAIGFVEGSIEDKRRAATLLRAVTAAAQA